MPGSHHITNTRIGTIEKAIYEAHVKLLANIGEAIMPREKQSMTTKKKITTLTDILSKRPDGKMPLEIMLETMDIYDEKYKALIAVVNEMDNPNDKAVILREAEAALETRTQLAALCAPYCHQRFASVTVSDITPKVQEETQFVVSFTDPSDVLDSPEAQEARARRGETYGNQQGKHMIGKSPSPYRQVTAEAQAALRRLKSMDIEITEATIESVLPTGPLDTRA
jgi:hypothetical protein